MNIIKGIDRIALLLATIVMVPVSVYTVVDLKKPTGENPEYKKWEKEYDDRIEYLEQINPSIKIDFKSYGKLKDFLKKDMNF